MGFLDAHRDGIKTRHEGRATWYSVKCNECGEHFEQKRYNSNHVDQYMCNKCKGNTKVAEDRYLYTAKELKFERAVERIGGMTKINDDYKRAINVVHKNLHNKGWFQSTEEIMVAIELLKNRVKVIHQQKVKNYKVDFVLPDMKVLLEVDGAIYHNNLRREGERDGNILLAMGLDWNVVRISTDRINKDVTKLMKAIKAVKECS